MWIQYGKWYCELCCCTILCRLFCYSNLEAKHLKGELTFFLLYWMLAHLYRLLWEHNSGTRILRSLTLGVRYYRTDRFGISVPSLIRYKPVPFGSWKNSVPRYFDFGTFGLVPVNTESTEQHVILGWVANFGRNFTWIHIE